MWYEPAQQQLSELATACNRGTFPCVYLVNNRVLAD